ncbi:AbrB/MazE/SpoVT family DNA-binding domain-containing protein [Roseomonas gilardii]|uniref:AbrB family transcriptional regulator n=1 Tax=Roseomonas gilardii TaxID=257708 RepID=A0A1L7AG19_9PROT|nr:AbrB/MazE/SpoVT family DNA-binding domain-containing protein [Roseomonas gilardii]APT57713.1 AbrB family transcriptional regulator [Roseomonas gilardii]MDT8329741.1 AbrB/MazE/SpoVT family DNA-binding domain-containing protein [Roseomonas gilardii]
MATIVTSKGQVTIPKPVRDLLGITTGTAVEFQVAPDGRVVLARADDTAAPRSRFERLRGAAGHGMSTDEIMALTRGD